MQTGGLGDLAGLGGQLAVEKTWTSAAGAAPAQRCAPPWPRERNGVDQSPENQIFGTWSFFIDHPEILL
jgi:hypothetical protein